MHLQFAPTGAIDDGREARDLAQPPAEIVILSAADTELGALARAAADRPPEAPGIALTNFLQLGHPMSVDLYVERTLARARYVVLRLLGGEGYWPYGIDSLRKVALGRKVPFACISGDARWDADFAKRSTVPAEEAQALWRYFAEGGPDNMRGALAFIDHRLGVGPPPAPSRPMPNSGFWPAPVPPDERPRAAIVFYRALVQGDMTAPVDTLAAALETRGIAAQPIFVSSLKDEVSARMLEAAFRAAPPDIILNATAFAVGTPDAADGSVLDRADCPVLQVAFAGSTEAEWRASARGLSPRDLAMHVVLPEVDGRIFAGALAFKERPLGGSTFAPPVSRPVADRIEAAADLPTAWIRLRRTPPQERRIALVVANYPDKGGKIAHGVGLDTPQSCISLFEALRGAGYRVDGTPETSAELMALLEAGLPRSDRAEDGWPLADYMAAFTTLPEPVRNAVLEHWGEPEADPAVSDGAMQLGLHLFGNVVIGVQPPRGFGIDPKDSYHAPDLAAPHLYAGFYLWLRHVFDAHAIVHVGKHGSLEWLPGKATGLSATCFPQALLGPLPNIYPFIVNDPGEGMQAKRRTAAVIIDHLTPPLARAELHGELEALERLVDEYALASDLDPTRAAILSKEITASAGALRLDADFEPTSGPVDEQETLRRLDAHLCDLKEMQIRDGLHVFGRSPLPDRAESLLVSIARLPRSELRPEDQSLHRALAADLGLDGFDPLTRDLARPYDGPRPLALARLSDRPWRSVGDTVERIELLAAQLVGDPVAADDLNSCDSKRAKARASHPHPHPEVRGEAEPRRSLPARVAIPGMLLRGPLARAPQDEGLDWG